MQAIILAAGMGKRLKELTKDNTKCMVKVNGVTLIERMLRQLENSRINRVIIVDGYMADKLENYISGLDISIPVTFIRNADYASTNNIYSLALAKEWLCKEDTLLLESDLIFEEEIINMLLNDPDETIALVDKYESWMDGTCVKINADGEIKEFIPGSKFRYEDVEYYYKTVNIYKFSAEFSRECYVPFLEAYAKALGNNEYYEQVLRVITLLDEPRIKAKKLQGQLWYEIDDIQDLDIAESIFSRDEEKTDLIQSRYGGYWRYPQMHDFCYAGNPFYPPKRMLDEIRANLSRIISAFPSGNRVNSLLAGKDMGVDTGHIVVSNGLEELIRSLFSVCGSVKKVGIVKPINEEFVRRFTGCKLVEYNLADKNMNIDIDDLTAFYEDKDIDMLIISNPNTHIGSYLSKTGMINVVKWAKKRNVRVIVDESYIDFLSVENGSLLDEGAYKSFENLIVLHNLSVAQGLFGLRIGCAVSSDMGLIKKLSNDMPIWNVNSVAEFYLQIMEKYKKDYRASLANVIETRNRLISDINSIEGLEALNTETSYVTCRITDPSITAGSLTQMLLTRYNILVKDLTGRVDSEDQYFRIAVKKPEENTLIVDALRRILMGGRIKGVSCVIDDKRTKDFFLDRVNKKLPHRYNYVIYQDDNPELALERDAFEKERILPFLIQKTGLDVLDIGCGVGRWGDELLKNEEVRRYVGVDYSDALLDIAKETIGDDKRVYLLCGSFQDLGKVLSKNKIEQNFQVILINGVLMYLNDNDISDCLNRAKELLEEGGVLYIKESVGREQRFTLSDFYSKEFEHNYNAIYRSIAEYQELLSRIFDLDSCTVIESGETWPNSMENRSETTSYFWIIKKGKN